MQLGALVLLALSLAGCAAETTELLFVRPGKFDYSTCEEIAKETQAVTAREQELRALTERAEREPFGAFIASTSYRSDHLRAQGQLKLLAEAASSKNCPPAPAPAAVLDNRPAPRR
jgi:hypothetical protein